MLVPPPPELVVDEVAVGTWGVEVAVVELHTAIERVLKILRVAGE